MTEHEKRQIVTRLAGRALRRGAGWRRPVSTVPRCFLGLEESDVCLLCLRRIGQHFGGTEYRCDPAPDEVRP